MDLTIDKIAAMSLEELVGAIEYHNKLYWEKAEPEISDDLYDALLMRLRSLDVQHPLLHKVYAPAAYGAKIRHAQPMLSLDKAYSLDEVLAWAKKYIRSENELFYVQPKYDGISARYDNGLLATRGDGFNGENISDKIPLIELETKGCRCPLQGYPGVVRGEIVIRDDDFKTLYTNIVRKDGTAYKNSRNAVAGIVGLKDISDMLAQKAKLTLVDYEMICYELPFSEFDQRWMELVEKIENLVYPLDGIVVKLADEEYSQSLGSTAHHPRGQIAFKFSGVRRESVITDVQWSFGKNNLTPVAEIEPVDIGGITIRHATLHNMQNVLDRDIHIGDKVVVERAGDVIPYIVSSSPGAERENCLIEHCPGCGGKLERSGPEIRCVNPECSETLLQKLCAAVKSVGIERLGEPNIRRMMQNLGVRSLRDIFNLTQDDILQLEGFQEKSANNLYAEIRRARNVNDFQLLAALNIPGIGPNIAKLLLVHYPLNELRVQDEETLAAIKGIGPERAKALRERLSAESEMIDELLECVELQQTSAADSGKKTICFTGKMPEKRSYYEELAAKHSYEAVDHVNSELDLLVAMDPASGGGKLAKAEKAGVKIISLEQWLDLLESGVQPEPDMANGSLEQGELGF